MRALVNSGPGKLEMTDWPTPEPGRGQVRVRTGACAICATDLEMIAGWERTGYPSIPGHEWAGTIHAVGEGVDRSWVGRHCVAENVLSDGGEVGFEHSGGYGEYLITEADHLQFLPSEFPLTTAALIEPLAVSVRALRRLCPHGDSALVFGDGPIGLLMAALLNRSGLGRVMLVGGRPGRLALAREWGAAAAYNYHQVDAGTAQPWRENGLQYSNVIEASGSETALRLALDAASRGGRVLVLGDYAGAEAAFRWNHLLHQELVLIGSCASAHAWPEAVSLAVSGTVPLERLVSHVQSVEDYEQALALVRSHGDDVIKVVLVW